MKFLFAILMLVLIARPALAHPLDDARAAMDRRDYATAAKLLQPLADQGDSEAEYLIGCLYRAGAGVPQDEAAAFNWFTKAAEQYYPYAQATLSALYAQGEGVKKDPVQAYKWLTIADNFESDQQSAESGLSADLESLAKKMRPADIDTAKRQARQWIDDHPPAKEASSSPKLFFMIFLLPAFAISCLPGRQQRFHYFYRAFTWIAFSLILFTPLFVVLNQPTPPQLDAPTMKAIGWALAASLAFVYAGWRCSSERLTFMDGLMFTVAAMRGIWSVVTTSALVVVTVPLLILIILGSVLVSLFNDLTRQTKQTPLQFERLISKIYKHRIIP